MPNSRINAGYNTQRVAYVIRSDLPGGNLFSTGPHPNSNQVAVPRFPELVPNQAPNVWRTPVQVVVTITLGP